VQRKQKKMKSLHHKKHEGITLINFKKVTSMIVVLSLVLSACGKNPMRRYALVSSPENDNIIAKNVGPVAPETGGTTKLMSVLEESRSEPGMGAGAFAVAAGMGVGRDKCY
jgi:hypothetical protein